MNDSWMSLVTLAQTQPQAGAAPATGAAQTVNPVGVPGGNGGTTGAPGSSQPLPAPSGGGAGGLGPMFWLIPAMILMMVLMSVMTGRKDKKKRAELMASLRRNARVQMVGGEIGTVVELSETEVVLRVEEGRIRFARSAVQTVLDAAKSKAESGAIAEVKGEAKATSV
jgi:preprotein translocase subunit YajC